METQYQTDIIRADANAAHYELQLQRANSERKCSKLILDFHNLSLRKAEEFVRARFWVGGAVHKAHSLSKQGDAIMAKLAYDTGVTESVLSGCLKLWDLCSGKVEKLQIIIDNVLETKGRIGWGDVETILKVNRERIRESRERRVIADRVEVIKREAPGVELRPAVAERLSQPMPELVMPDLAKPEPASRITSRRTLRSIASACNELAADLENGGSIPIQEINIEGAGAFEVVVSLVPISG